MHDQLRDLFPSADLASAQDSQESEPEFTARDLYEMAYQKLEEETEAVLQQRRAILDRHRRELSGIENRLTKLKNTKRRLMEDMSGLGK